MSYEIHKNFYYQKYIFHKIEYTPFIYFSM
jgi:hypothetical protein